MLFKKFWMEFYANSKNTNQQVRVSAVWVSICSSNSSSFLIDNTSAQVVIQCWPRLIWLRIRSAFCLIIRISFWFLRMRWLELMVYLRLIYFWVMGNISCIKNTLCFPLLRVQICNISHGLWFFKRWLIVNAWA